MLRTLLVSSMPVFKSSRERTVRLNTADRRRVLTRVAPRSRQFANDVFKRQQANPQVVRKRIQITGALLYAGDSSFSQSSEAATPTKLSHPS